jgi:hypothetical protein
MGTVATPCGWGRELIDVVRVEIQAEWVAARYQPPVESLAGIEIVARENRCQTA